MVMEYSDKNLLTLMNNLKANHTYLSEIMLTHIFRGGIVSFKRMAKMGIFHRNIKPENLLVAKPNWIRIIDFSNSLRINSNHIEDYSIAGLSAYSAPEIQALLYSNESHGQYNLEKADIFSLGLVFLQIITLCDISSFNTIDSNSRLIAFINTIVLYEWAKKLLLTMLNIDPQRRMAFSELKQFIPNLT